jgi:midasin
LLHAPVEPERKLFVAERGGVTENDTIVAAAQQFRIFGTMNPGGDYGKKEVSSLALRHQLKLKAFLRK